MNNNVKYKGEERGKGRKINNGNNKEGVRGKQFQEKEVRQERSKKIKKEWVRCK